MAAMTNAQNLKIVIVGGVAAGASAAARARRLSESAQIVVLERGPHVSFANCGLPYFLGGEITEEKKLLLQTPQSLHARFGLDVRVNSEVTGLDRVGKTVQVQDLSSGHTYSESYDRLILATGAAPVRPPISGLEQEGHFFLRDIPDMQQINQWIKAKTAQTAVVVGGGYIGLEMAEQLTRRGLKVSLTEALPQVMSPLDPELAAMLHEELRRNGVALHLGDGVSAFAAPEADEQAAASVVVLASGKRLPADVVILGLGVRPETKLAKDAGLEIGTRGGVRVNEHLQTSDPDIWAVGDCVEVRDFVTGEWTLVPLAGPANRMGRMAADNIFGALQKYAGTLGTGILRLFDLSAGCTGANEKTLLRLNLPYESVHLHPGSHAGYYPGAAPIALKVLFDPQTGKLLGGQAVGNDGVDKRIDVLATAILAGMTVDDLAELELAYAPPFGSAKDPLNLAGMAAQNVLSGKVRQVQWNEIARLDPEKTFLLDVREEKERAAGFLPDSVHIPLNHLRTRLGELPKDKEIVAYCHSGQRSYYACRILAWHGFSCRNLSGAWKTWKTVMSLGL